MYDVISGSGRAPSIIEPDIEKRTQMAWERLLTSCLEPHARILELVRYEQNCSSGMVTNIVIFAFDAYDPEKRMLIIPVVACENERIDNKSRVMNEIFIEIRMVIAQEFRRQICDTITIEASNSVF